MVMAMDIDGGVFVTVGCGSYKYIPIQARLRVAHMDCMEQIVTLS